MDFYLQHSNTLPLAQQATSATQIFIFPTGTLLRINTLNTNNTMTSENGIPVMNKPANQMESGANGNNLAAASVGRHPVELLQQRQGTTLYESRDNSMKRKRIDATRIIDLPSSHSLFVTGSLFIQQLPLASPFWALTRKKKSEACTEVALP